MTQPRKRSTGATGTRSTARKRTADSDGSDPAPRKRASAPRTGTRNGSNRALSPVQIARAAAEQLSEISGVDADSISGLERTEDGWLVRVEVVEVQRIPDSTSVMA